MTEIRFYHLERQSLDQALPALVMKAFENGHRIVIKARDERQREALNDQLWTFNPNVFLPHGSAKDGNANAALQPIWLTCEDENPNEADVLILADACGSAMQDQFALCCEMFNGNDPETLSAARSNWKTYKDQDHSLTYWQQGAKGWEQKS